MPKTPALIAGAFELMLVIAGIVLLARWGFTGAARRHRAEAQLGPWPGDGPSFLLFFAYVVGSWILFGGAAAGVASLLELGKSSTVLFVSGAAQAGWLAGATAHRAQYVREPPRVISQPGKVVLTGIATFLISLPILAAVSLAWRALLKAADYPIKQQEMIELFRQIESPVVVAGMIFMTVVLAPIAEEMVFRAGLFRFARTRIGYGLALLAPAILFSVMHANVAGFLPLAALAVILSVAYERTGHVGTPIIAHALFNLNSVVMLLCGATELS